MKTALADDSPHKIVAVDFDGTIVDHRYPDIGAPVPGAIEWLTAFQRRGIRLILLTMRHDHPMVGPVLNDAIAYVESAGITLFGVNENPDQHWSMSRKVYAHAYIDDAAIGCPLRENPRMGGRPFVDWDIAGPMTLERLGLETKGGGG